MNDKCTKYEGLFIFSDEETLKKHIETCPDCAKEDAEMKKVSELIQEVKPYFVQKRKNYLKLKAICAVSVMILCTTTLGVINLNTDISDTIKYGNVLSADDLGLPVDSYGLLMVE